MLASLRRRLSYANVVATMALFVALGGTSYAALTVTSKNVKNNSLTTKDLKNNTVKSVDVRNGSLLSKDFKAGQLPAGPQGPAGPAGQSGEPGPAGANETDGTDGTNGATNVTIRREFISVGGSNIAYCEGNEKVIGGGVGSDSYMYDINTSKPFPGDPASGPDTGWLGIIQTDTNNDGTGTVYVVCASP